MNVQMEERLAVANTLREQEKFSESAARYTDCLIDLADTQDWQGLIHCLGGQSLIYKILSSRNGSPVYNALTISFAKEAYEIAEQNKDILDGNTLAVAYRVYGDALLTVGDTESALPLFQNAYNISIAGIAEKGMLKAHIGGIKYLLGDKPEGIMTIKEALEEIRQGDMADYTVRVWETGALNKLAQMYSEEGDFPLALSYVEEALSIAKNHSLTIREKESQKLFDKISSGQTGKQI